MKRLTDAERLARKRERSRKAFAEASYDHYDASGGFGQWEQWEQAAEALAAGLGFTRDTSGLDAADREALAALGLSSLPANIAELKTAFRRRAFAAHPDYGGTSESFRAIYAAFERLVNRYKEGA